MDYTKMLKTHYCKRDWCGKPYTSYAAKGREQGFCSAKCYFDIRTPEEEEKEEKKKKAKSYKKFS